MKFLKKRKSCNQKNLLSQFTAANKYGLAIGQRLRGWGEPDSSATANELIYLLATSDSASFAQYDHNEKYE